MIPSQIRKTLLIFFIGLFSSIQAVYASLLDDANTLFDWAEPQYPQLFSPSGQPTLTAGTWIYRYYPGTQIYVGVNDQREVYLLGGSFGSEPTQVGLLDDFLAQINANSSNTGSGTNSAGNGNCVTLPYPATGLQANYNVTSDGTTGTISVTYTSTGPTQSTSETTSSFSGSGTSSSSSTTTTQNYSIISDYLYVESVETVVSTTVPGLGSLDETTSTTFSPAQNDGPALKYCEQQSWTSDSVTQTTSTINFGVPSGAISSSTEVVNGLVEAVNESVTVPAGTFTTVRVKENSSGEDTITWFSTELGIFVKVQTLNGNGTVTSETELASTN